MSQEIRTATIKEDIESFFVYRRELDNEEVKNEIFELSLRYRSFVVAEYLFDAGAKVTDIRAFVEETCQKGHFETIEWMQRIDSNIPYGLEVMQKDETRELKLITEKSSESTLFDTEIVTEMILESQTPNECKRIRLFAPKMEKCRDLLAQIYEACLSYNNMNAAKILHAVGARMIMREQTLKDIMKNKNRELLQWVRENDKPVPEKCQILTEEMMDDIIFRDDAENFDTYKEQFDEETLFYKCLLSGSDECMMCIRVRELKPMKAFPKSMALLARRGYDIEQIVWFNTKHEIMNAFLHDDMESFEEYTKKYIEAKLDKCYPLDIMNPIPKGLISWLLSTWSLSMDELKAVVEVNQLETLCEAIIEIEDEYSFMKLPHISKTIHTYGMVDFYTILTTTKESFATEKAVDEYLHRLPITDNSYDVEVIVFTTLRRLYTGRDIILRKTFARLIDGHKVRWLSKHMVIPWETSQQTRDIAYGILQTCVSPETNIDSLGSHEVLRVMENAKLACICANAKHHLAFVLCNCVIFETDVVQYIVRRMDIEIPLEWIMRSGYRTETICRGRLFCKLEGFHRYINEHYRLTQPHTTSMYMLNMCPRNWKFGKDQRLIMKNHAFRIWAMKLIARLNGIPKVIEDEMFWYLP
jgi:hypothetical protein